MTVPAEPADILGTAERSRATATAEAREELLRAACLLLARGSSLRAVRSLHAAVEGTNAAQTRSDEYSSRAHAERAHLRIVDQVRARRAPVLRITNLPQLARRASVWLGWGIFWAIALGLFGRYGLALARRWRWQGEHPDGAWISRYYSNVRFEGFPVTRYDDALSYNFHAGAPADGMLRDLWSARWDSCADVKRDVKLDLTLAADDSAQLFVDGAERLEILRAGKTSGTVALTAGIHRVRVNFVERWGSARIHLRGIEYRGTEDYSFRRPLLRGDDASCE